MAASELVPILLLLTLSHVRRHLAAHEKERTEAFCSNLVESIVQSIVQIPKSRCVLMISLLRMLRSGLTVAQVERYVEEEV